MTEKQEGWRKPREKIYIALEDKNLDWTEHERTEFLRLWREDYFLHQIAEFLKRDQLETFLLYLDQVEKNKIEPRLKVKYD
jgi:hypothetical protein